MRRLFPFHSIRATLLLLVLLAVLPALVIVLHTGSTLRSTVVGDAERYALHQVQAMAAHHERVIENARLLLMTLAATREIRNLEEATTTILLNDLLGRHAAYVSLALADAQGTVIAAAPTRQSPPFSLAASSFFANALKNKSFTVGEYTLLKEQHRVVIQFGQPVLANDGAPLGLLIASFDLNYFAQIFADLHLPESSVFTLTDAHGIRLTRFPETSKYTWVQDLPQMVARMSGPEEQGTFEETGVDGVRRLYGFKRLSFQGASFPSLMIRLGIPVDKALAEAKAVMARNILLLVLATLLALVTAWFVGEFTIMRQLAPLMAATRELEAGNLGVRTGIPATRGELGKLAAAFDTMAGELERKEAERSQAADELLRLNEELEQRVVQRTEQLARANSELELTLEDLKRTQSQLIMSEKLAALGELVAGVAHEINTPVGVALSASSTLAEKINTLAVLFEQGEMKRSDLTGFLEDGREGAAMVQVNLNRASDLIRSFKMVAVDQVSEARRSFHVRAYIDEVLLSLRPKLKRTAHTVEVVCNENLVIESYPGAFSQILTNFIVNSLVHAFAPEQAGKIRIAVSKSERGLELCYADDGLGMNAEVQARMFEPFFTTARSQGSTGLGLHIVFNLVTHTLGGTISCESDPGQGTRFTVVIPV